uniref:Guanylate cyclase domain-containing protein n=1 Tax=Alexandrium andersonii TaxID=327968 RepID=A0A6U6SDX2_9DINO
MKAAGHENHEFAIQEILANGDSQVQSLAMFDIHRSQREGALLSLAQTVSVVVLLLALVIYFASDMKRLSNNNVLHPLWDLMDDMCALKSIEVVGEQRVQEDDMNTLVALYQPKRTRWLRWRCRQHIPVADELVQLRRAFDKLRTAMLSWSKFVPVVLLKQLFEAGVEAKIGCSNCEVSVFFCDIDDFKELCEGSKPREVLQLLETVLSHIYEALADNGGTLLEFIGDEVLAVFNAPCPTSNHAFCAVTAALEAQERLDALPGVPVRLRCSVHQAHVLAGNIGSPSRMKYGALGDGVNLAARLKSLNTRYGTHLLVSSDTLSFKNAHEVFITRPVGKLVLKGRTTPTLTYEVLGKRSTASPLIADAADKHQRGFDLFLDKRFAEAKSLFDKVADLLAQRRDAANDSDSNCDENCHVGVADRLSQHLGSLCDKYLSSPPPDGWDGSEHLKKKAW